MGVQVSEAGRTAERVDLISTAIDNAPQTLSPYTQSFLYLHKAEALSRDGDHRNAGTALNQAVSLWEHGSVEENPDWLNWFGEAQLKSTEGKVLLRSGQVERATSSLETSVESAAPRDKAVRSSRLAEARLMRRRPGRGSGRRELRRRAPGEQCQLRTGPGPLEGVQRSTRTAQIRLRRPRVPRASSGASHRGLTVAVSHFEGQPAPLEQPVQMPGWTA